MQNYYYMKYWNKLVYFFSCRDNLNIYCLSLF